jgi:hypothetical protein
MTPSCNGSIKIDGASSEIIPSSIEKFCTALGWVSVTKVTRQISHPFRQNFYAISLRCHTVVATKVDAIAYGSGDVAEASHEN